MENRKWIKEAENQIKNTKLIKILSFQARQISITFFLLVIEGCLRASLKLLKYCKLIV